jgi:NADH:ubiquinone oxidoreductase subunit 3 (subunit A)
MTEYWPFLVILAFGSILFLGTLLWTEVLFPEPKSTREIADVQISQGLHQALAAQIADLMHRYKSGEENFKDDQQGSKGSPAVSQR